MLSTVPYILLGIFPRDTINSRILSKKCWALEMKMKMKKKAENLKIFKTRKYFNLFF